MEVEVKLRLPNESNHSRLKTLLSPFHIKTLTQQNIFFDSADASLSSHRAVLRFRFFEDAGVSRCIVALKARPTLVNGVSRVEEDEEEIGADVGRQCVADLSRLSLIGSRLVKRCREEFGIGDEMGFVCLGGFGNVREVFEWRGLKLEVDETKYEFGVCYEVECESDDPERVKRELEELLNENGIEYKYSEMSKFAVFRSGKLPYNPYVMGTSVVALKYKDGILMAADMGGSYGSTLRYKSVEREKPIGKNSLLGASGQLAKLGLAPFLWCTILLLLVTYIYYVVIASNLPRVTARFGLLAWLGVFLATSGLAMFYRCSRKDPGYIMMNGSDLQNVKDEPLLKIEMNNPALLAGNWSQLCATCKAASSVTNNGKLSGRSMDYDGENSNADEQHFSEEVQTDYGQENVGEVDDLSQDEAAAEASWEKEGKSENHQYSSKQDSLVESVLTLQAVQRALQSG